MFVSPLRFLRRVLHMRRAEGARALRLSEQRFHEIWDAAADAMVLSNAEAIVVAANPAYYELYGYQPEQVLGHSFAIIFPSERRPAAVAAYTAIFNSRTTTRAYESTITRSDGTERMVESRATFVTINGDQPALLSIVRDITVRKQLAAERDALLVREQAARVEAETALRIRDQFLAVAAHELKTPLTSLSGYTQVVRQRAEREHSLSERDLHALHVIDSQATRLHSLIDSLLDIGRVQAGAFRIVRRPLELNILVRALVEELQPALEQHTLQLETSLEPLLIAGDAGRLEQVVQNLLQNAVKYSPAGGVVTICLQRRGDCAELTVGDQGIGIPATAQAHLFQQFYRAPNAEERHIQGMGIGLYVVKEIVSLHDGDISVTSQEGRGSTFTVALPLYDTAVR